MAEKKDITFRNAKPEAKAYKISDEKGLFMHVTPQGNKYWRFKYRFGGKVLSDPGIGYKSLGFGCMFMLPYF